MKHLLLCTMLLGAVVTLAASVVPASSLPQGGISLGEVSFSSPSLILMPELRP